MKANTTAETVLKGVELCKDNARRLLRNALLILDSGGSDGLAYALWSLAVEEFGKSRLLKAQVDGLDAATLVVIEYQYEHAKKFTEGFDVLSELQGTQIARLFRVHTNSGATATFQDPLRPGTAVSVPAGTSGVFKDVSNPSGVDPTVALRMALIYVDWNETAGRWQRPGETLCGSGVVGRWELSASDLRRAIKSLEKHIGQ